MGRNPTKLHSVQFDCRMNYWRPCDTYIVLPNKWIKRTILHNRFGESYILYAVMPARRVLLGCVRVSVSFTFPVNYRRYSYCTTNQTYSICTQYTARNNLLSVERPRGGLYFIFPVRLSIWLQKIRCFDSNFWDIFMIHTKLISNLTAAFVWTNIFKLWLKFIYSFDLSNRHLNVYYIAIDSKE